MHPLCVRLQVCLVCVYFPESPSLDFSVFAFFLFLLVLFSSHLPRINPFRAVSMCVAQFLSLLPVFFPPLSPRSSPSPSLLYQHPPTPFSPCFLFLSLSSSFGLCPSPSLESLSLSVFLSLALISVPVFSVTILHPVTLCPDQLETSLTIGKS